MSVFTRLSLCMGQHTTGSTVHTGAPTGVDLIEEEEGGRHQLLQRERQRQRPQRLLAPTQRRKGPPPLPRGPDHQRDALREQLGLGVGAVRVGCGSAGEGAVDAGQQRVEGRQGGDLGVEVLGWGVVGLEGFRV